MLKKYKVIILTELIAVVLSVLACRGVYDFLQNKYESYAEEKVEDDIGVLESINSRNDNSFEFSSNSFYFNLGTNIGEVQSASISILKSLYFNYWDVAFNNRYGSYMSVDFVTDNEETDKYIVDDSFVAFDSSDYGRYTWEFSDYFNDKEIAKLTDYYYDLIEKGRNYSYDFKNLEFNGEAILHSEGANTMYIKNMWIAKNDDGTYFPVKMEFAGAVSDKTCTIEADCRKNDITQVMLNSVPNEDGGYNAAYPFVWKYRGDSKNHDKCFVVSKDTKSAISSLGISKVNVYFDIHSFILDSKITKLLFVGVVVIIEILSLLIAYITVLIIRRIRGGNRKVLRTIWKNMSPTAKKVWVVLIVFVALVTEISYNFADSKLHSEEFRDHFRKNYVYKKTEDENIFAIKRENYLGRGNVGGSMYNKQLSYTFCSDNPDSLIFKEEMMEEIYLTSSYLFDHYISKSTEMTDADNYVGMDRLFDDYHEKTYANHSYSDRWKRDKANKVFRNAKITVNNEKTKDEVYTRSVDGKVFYMKDYVFDLKMNASDLDWLESIGYDSVSIKYTKDRYSIIDVGPTTIVRSSMAPSLNMYEANLTEKNVRRNSNDYLMPMATKWIGKDEKSGNPKMVAVSLKAMEDVKVNTAFVKYYISSDWGSGFTCKIHFNVLNSILINKSMCEIDFDKIESEYPLLTKKFKTDYNVNYYEDYKKDTENWLYDLKKGEVYTVVMPVSEKSLGIMDNFCMVLASTKGETEVELKYDYSSADFTDEQIIDSMSENAVFNGVYERK